MSFHFESRPTFRDLQGKFSRATANLLRSRVALLRSEAQRFIILAGEEAPGGRGGTIGRGMSYRIFQASRGVGFQFDPGRIGRFHAFGTGLYGPLHHLIRPKRAHALHFFIDGEELFRAWVRGVRPNRFVGRAYRRWLPGAGAALRRISTRFAQDFTRR